MEIHNNNNSKPDELNEFECEGCQVESSEMIKPDIRSVFVFLVPGYSFDFNITKK